MNLNLQREPYQEQKWHLLKNEIREIEKYAVEYQSLDKLTELISKLDSTIEKVVNSLKHK